MEKIKFSAMYGKFGDNKKDNKTMKCFDCGKEIENVGFQCDICNVNLCEDCYRKSEIGLCEDCECDSVVLY